jgi:adenine specific DNA methylase Mod
MTQATQPRTILQLRFAKKLSEEWPPTHLLWNQMMKRQLNLTLTQLAAIGFILVTISKHH